MKYIIQFKYTLLSLLFLIFSFDKEGYGINSAQAQFTKLQILMPGETAAPNTVSGKTGVPLVQVAGVPFTVIVNAVDANWNIVNTAPANLIRLTTANTLESLPTDAPLINGTVSFNITLKVARSSFNITASNITDGSKTASTSSNTILGPAAYSQLQILVEGESPAPGTTTGKIGNPNIKPRGSLISVTTRAVDEFFNLRTDISNSIVYSSSDPTAYLPSTYGLSSGQRTYFIRINRTGIQTLTGRDVITNFTRTINISEPTTPSAATHHFRSFQTGDWNNTSSWESSSDSLTWIPATLVPNANASSVSINNGHTITITSNNNAKNMRVLSTAILSVNPGVSFTISNGPEAFDCRVLGTLANEGNIVTTGTLVFEGGGVYRHGYMTTPGTVPGAIWNDGSTCMIVGYTSAQGNIGGLNQNFFDFTWNCPNQNVTTSLSLAIANTTIRNNLNILNTGIAAIQFFNGSGNLSVRNLNLINGTVDFINNSDGALTGSLNISGDVFISGGVLRKGNNTSIGRIVFNGTSNQIFTKTGGAFAGTLSFVINTGATVDFGTSIISGSTGNFTLNNGATLTTAHPDGISSSGATGTIQNTGSRTFNTGASYTYNGSTAQQTGTGLPPTVNNLTINNPAGVQLRTGSLAITNSLAIQNGTFDLGTNPLVSNGAVGSTGNGTLSTQNTGATPLTSGKTWGGTVQYNATASQTIVDGNYNNLNSVGGLRVLPANLNIAGVFTPGSSVNYNTQNTNINFNGAGAQTIPTFTYFNLTASTGGTKTVSGAASVSNTLTVNSPAVLNANGNLTLLATATNNANLAALSGSADIIGNVNVQSFISGAANAGFRGTRSMSSPVNDAAISGAKTFEQLKNYMIVTGSGGVANGFDAVPNGVSNSTILFTYNNSLSSPFVPITNITTPLASGSGFMYFFMGNRNNKDSNPGKLIPPFVSPENVTLTYTGPVNKGNIDIPINYNASKTSMQGAFIAGNPYPATIDWNAVQASSANIGSTITVVVGGKPNATYNATLGEGTNGGSRYIQPGQGFYVYAGVGGGILRFRETHKNISEAPARLLATKERYFLQSATGGSTVSFSRTTSDNTNTRTLRMALESGQMVEETLVAFGEGFNAIADEQDSRYITGYDVNLATLSADKKPLAINLLPEGQTELALSVNSRASGNMKLRFTDLPNISGMQMMLKDHYLNLTVPITDVNSAYEFAIQKNVAASFGDQRFTLAFAPLTTLPLSFVDFKVNKVLQTAELSWSTADEVYNDFFEVERSTDGKTFLVLKKVEPQPSTGAINNYKSVDDKPFKGVNYYRIKQTDKDGTYSFSKLQSIDFSDLRATTTDAAIQIYPNPTENYLFLSTIKKDSQAVNLRIIDMNGVVKKSFVFKTEDEIKLNVEDLASGLYMVEMLNTSSEERIGTAKFIKK